MQESSPPPRRPHGPRRFRDDGAVALCPVCAADGKTTVLCMSVGYRRVMVWLRGSRPKELEMFTICCRRCRSIIAAAIHG